MTTRPERAASTRRPKTEQAPRREKANAATEQKAPETAGRLYTSVTLADFIDAAMRGDGPKPAGELEWARAGSRRSRKARG